MRAKGIVHVWMVAYVVIAVVRGQLFAVITGDDTYAYNETVSLRCVAVLDSGVNSFNWLVPDGSTALLRGQQNMTTDATSVLTFTALEEDSGEYTCLVESGSEMASEKTTVTIVPAILSEPVDMTLEYSDDLTATFTCTAFGGNNSVLVLSWTHSAGASLNTDTESTTVNPDNSTTSTITTDTLTVEDRGSEYTCDVTYDGSSSANEATATLSIVPAILEGPQSILVGVGLGRNASFTCTAYGGPLDTSPPLIFTWSGPVNVTLDNVDTLEPVNDTVIYTSVLTLVNVTVDFEGNYSCSVAYSDMPELMSTSEIATLGAITDPPDITEPPMDTVESRGNNATFTCSAVGNGTLNITWRLPSGGIVYTDQYMENEWSITSSLSVTDITADDGGNYTCIVGNEVGEIEATAVLSVRLYISGEQVGLNTTNGALENITCMIEGFPIIYSWEKMDDVMDGSVSGNSDSNCGDSDSGSSSGDLMMPDQYSEVSTGRVLEFDPVTFGDEGVYRCVASSDIGDELVSAAITVTISPEGGVSVTPVGMVYDEGDNVTFSCSAEGGPQNTLQWLKDGKDFGSIICGSENNLTLTSITIDDGAVYTCEASNAAGTGSASVSLNISPVIVLHPVNIGVFNGTNASFMCEATAFPEPTYVWITVGGELPESALGVNSSTLMLNPAVFGDQGEYYCSATSNGITVSSNTTTLTISPEGGVTINPDDETFNDLDTVLLVCMTVGGPGNTFQWSFNGDDLVDEISSTLILMQVTAGNGGIYTCTVTNSAGSGSYSTYVFISPMITLNPNSSSVSNGTEEVSFTCNATGFPEPDIEWFRVNGSLPDTASGENTNTLTIAPVIFGDEGEYFCVATSNELTVESEPATLTIAPRGSISTNNTVATVGESFMFTCNVLGGLGNVFQWQLESTVLPDETMDTLLLIDVTVSDAGSYSCVVTNDAGEDTAEYELFIEPHIITSPQNEEVDVAVSAVFTCVAEGVPVPNIAWEYVGDGEGSGGGLLFESGSSLGAIDETVNGTTVTSTLTLDPIQYDDYGLYRCVATSNILMMDFTAVSDTAVLTVSPDGSVTVTPTVINAQRNTTHTLMCSAFGGPNNTFRWYIDGVMVGNSSVLTIEVVSAPVGGDYQCTVENSAGSGSATATVNVVPVIIQQPVAKNVTRTEALELVCVVDGFPLPSIVWTHNGTDIPSDDPRITDEVSMDVERMSTLSVNNTSINDSGVYVCIAVSPTFDDVSSDPAVVLIQDRPEQPQDLMAFNINSRRITLQWVEPHHNNAPVTGYRVMYTEPDFLGGVTVTVASSDEVHVITGLHPGVEYVFTVIAINDIGESVPSDEERATTLEEVPSNSTQNVTVTTVSSTTLTIAWEEVPLIDQNGIITEYEIQIEPKETFDGLIPTITVNTSNGSVLTIVVTGLEECVEYYISVRAYTSVGPGPYSDVIVEKTNPAAPSAPPQNVTATAVSSTEIRVLWEEVPAIDQNGVITMYEILYVPLETFGEQITSDTVNTSDGSVLMMVLTDLEEYVEYNISVRAYTSAGTGPYSDGVVERTDTDEPVEPPQNVTAIAMSSTEIVVLWEEVPAIDQNGVITLYVIQFEPLETCSGQITSDTVNTSNGSVLMMVLTDLEEYVEYNISVRAYTSAGPGPYSDGVVERTDTDTPDNPPQNVTASVVSSTEIEVSWEDLPAICQNGVITMYEIQFVPLETFGEQITSDTVNTSNGSVLMMVLTGLEEYVEYNISVRAYTSAGPGPYSDPVTERTLEDVPSEAPLNVMLMVESSTAIRVSWEEVPAIDENGIIIMYQVQYDPLETFGGLISINITDTSMLSTVLTDLEEYVEYNISVRAYTSAGPGPYSIGVSNRTETDEPHDSPQNVTATAVSSTEIEVLWEEVPAIDQNGVITMYEIQFEPLETFGGQITSDTVNTSDGSVLMILTGLEEYVEYNISVRAYTSVGPGPYSDGVVERTDTDTPDDPPQNVTATVVSSTKIEVSWEDLPAICQNGVITMYEILYEPLETFSGQITSDTANTSNGSVLMMVLTGLEEYVEYNISVRAYTSAGPGPYSDPVTERTLEDVPGEAPLNVMLMVESSTAITVSWEEVPAIDENGIIIMYQVQYDPLETFGEQIFTKTVNITDTSMTVLTDLEEYVEYNISVRAYTSIGPGPYSDPSTARTETDKPDVAAKNVMAIVESPTEIRVSWEEVPAIDRNGVITMYEIQFVPLETFGGQITSDTVNTSNGSVLMMVLTGLEEYVEYNISVRAYTSAGPGPYSVGVVERTDTDEPDAPPQNVMTMVLSSTEIEVSWEEVPAINQNGIITMYEVQYIPLETFGGQISTTTANVTNTSLLFIVLTGLEEYVEYNISVRAYTSVGPGPYSIGVVERTDTDEPNDSPQNVTATAVSSTEIEVSWTDVPAIDQNGVITMYEIQFEPLETCSGQITSDTVNTSNGSILMIVLTGLEEYVEYNISVRAYTSAGPGPYSDGVVERTETDAPDNPPQNVTATVVSSTEIVVSWEDLPAICQNGEITMYEILYEPLETFGGQITSDTVNTSDGSVLMMVLTGLEEYVEYNISVRAYTSAGPGPYSDPVTNTTLEDVPFGYPMNITATALSPTEIRVNWTTFPMIDHNGIITSYEVQFNQTAAVLVLPSTDTVVVPPDNFTVVLTGLGPLLYYTVTVRAHTIIGPGPYNPDNATAETEPGRPIPPPPPPPPENITRPPDLPPDMPEITVTLEWKPSEAPGGELLGYFVILVALGDASLSESRRRREAGGNFLSDCVMNNRSNISVPPDVTQLDVTATAYTTYEFQVQARNGNGTGELSNATQFSTPESVPSIPEDLLVEYDGSMSLMVSWNPPLCDYGIRTNYTFSYVETESEIDANMEVLGTDASNMTLTDLFPNTNYTVTVCAATRVGCGVVAVVINSTDEDSPQEVTDLEINDASRINDSTVMFSIVWVRPSDSNGSFHYVLEYEAAQLEPHPQSRQRNVSLIQERLDNGKQETFTFEGALPFANYTITLTPVNTKLTKPGPNVTIAGRTRAIAPTSITELSVEPVSSTNLRVSWELPEFPNGPLSHYIVYYQEQNSTEIPSPIVTDDYLELTVDYPRTSVTIGELDPFTYYTVIVQAVGEGDLMGLLTAASVFMNRTHADVDTPPTTDPTAETDIGEHTFQLSLPDPLEIDTGLVIFYAIIVIRINDNFNVENPPDRSSYSNAEPFDSTIDPPQEYYITAAWTDPTGVPDVFTVGDGNVIVTGGTAYENVRLSSDTDYAYLIRIDIMSDTDEMLVVYSDFEFFKTETEPNLGVAVGVPLTFIILILAALAMAGVLLYVWWRRRVYKDLYGGVIAEIPDSPNTIQMQPVIVNPNPVSPYSGTLEPIPLDKFKEHVQRMHSNDDYLFSEEYNSIEPTHAPTSIASHLSCNVVKNRYANIVAYDHSRVKMTEDPNKEGSDYINANLIDGYKQRNAFIAAQGPNPDTVADFWRMVWEQGSATIVMLTNLEEKGRVKCHRYWPEEKSEQYGRIKVQLEESLVLADYTQRSFSLVMNGSKEERIVTQYHYTVWPDHGVPEYPTSLLLFVRKVMSLSPENSGPIVVHCSAGVGRTGTFMTLYSQLKRMEIENNFDIFGYVRSMRYSRNCMVQTEPQYVFIHDALLESIECGVTEVPARELQEQYRQLCEVDVEAKVTGLALEFDKLDITIHRKLRRNTGTLVVNKPKNRYGANKDAIPYDRNRCRLSTIPGVEGSDYINASFVDGYHKPRAFIATQGPLPDTQDDFWRLVWEQKVMSIIMLTKEKEAGKVRCHRYWPLSGAEQYGKLQVILHTTTDYHDYILREFKLVDTQDGSSLSVKQFQYMDWPEDSVPSSGSGLIDLIGQVQKWQMSSGDKPIIVHCSGGCGRTGTYIAVSILIERLKTEGVVDVFHTVRNLRLQRPGMVNTESQLNFCYKTTLEYLESFELYDNFK